MMFRGGMAAGGIGNAGGSAWSGTSSYGGATGGGGGGGGGLFNDNDDDMGEEYEEKKRLKEVQKMAEGEKCTCILQLILPTYLRGLLTQINLHWLHRWCLKVTGSETAMAIADSVCNVLLLDKGPEEAAAELLELLGFSAFEEVTALMEQRCDDHGRV